MSDFFGYKVMASEMSVPTMNRLLIKVMFYQLWELRYHIGNPPWQQRFQQLAGPGRCPGMVAGEPVDYMRVYHGHSLS